jgi:hypothetical protein
MTQKLSKLPLKLLRSMLAAAVESGTSNATIIRLEIERREKPKQSGKSLLEERFATALRVGQDAPPYEREFHFHPTRKWRIDFAWPRHRLAVEIDGGIWIGGGHNRGKTFANDAEKHNALTVLGWRLLRYTTRDLERRPLQCAAEVAALLAKITPGDGIDQKELFEAEL